MRRMPLSLFISLLFTIFVFTETNKKPLGEEAKMDITNTRADVISGSGKLLVFNKGSIDGVRTGISGIVKTIIIENGKQYDINVGIIIIKSVTEKTSEAYITQLASGMNAQQAKFVVFDENLVLPPPGKTIDWYLEKGDDFFDKGKYHIANMYYKKMLKIEPGDPIGWKKVMACNQKVNSSNGEKRFKNYFERAEKYLNQGKIDYALEYYLAAYKLLPTRSDEIAGKFKKVSEDHTNEWETFKCKHLSELEPILDKYFIPPGMPEEVYKIKSKAKRVYKNKKDYWEAEFDYNIVMIYIPAGEFSMGSNKEHIDERPVHTIFLDGYWIGKYEVTQGQWKAVIGNNPSHFNYGDNYPVEKVSWHDVQKFIQKLNSWMGLSFHLPTETEWEKAARGADQRKYPWGDRSPSCSIVNSNECKDRTMPVGSYTFGVSPYGAHDMAGNVWEWCSDWYDKKYYDNSPKYNPSGPLKGSNRVKRGGGWKISIGIRCTYRGTEIPHKRLDDVGFRLCMD